MSNDVVTNKANVAPSLKDMSVAELATLTGQEVSNNEGQSLPRLAINHAEEDNDGKTIPRGQFSLKLPDGVTAYAKEAHIRIFYRLFTYSRWDVEQGSFGCQTIQTTSLGADFYDTEGNMRCGRLTKDEAAGLAKDSPEMNLHKSVKCNQILYNTVQLVDPVDADGHKVVMPDEVPSVWYIRGSSFIPVSDHIKMIARQKQIMCTVVNKATTARRKMAGNSYYVPVMATLKTVEIKDTDQELMTKFFETKEAINNKVMGQWREAKEKNAKLGDLNDFGDVLSATG
jgi:hypothetical protein|tara:strand:- start:628 stop:1482 length:855 start_codon:yes stop_codon:yes gene_type:complete